MDIRGIADKEHYEHGLKMIALRTDMDALRMTEDTNVDFKSVTDHAHMCGHDGHMSIMMATAEYLVHKKDRIPNNKCIRLIWQPAEEGLTGANMMIKDGCLEGVQQIYGLHNFHLGRESTISFKSGEMMAGSSNVDIEIEGVGGHGSEPALSVDPITAICHIHVALHSIKSRILNNKDKASLTFGTINAGGARNVIPKHAKMEGKIRWYCPEVRDKIKDTLTKIATSTAEAFGCTAKVGIVDKCEALINHEEPSKLVRNVIIESFGKENLNEHVGIPNFASEDFANYLAKVPGAFFFVNNIKPDS